MIDVAIIGAGVAGCTAALALSSTHRVSLIDKRAEPFLRIGECLPAAARRILRQLGLLRLFEQEAHLPSMGMQSWWGSDHKQVVDAICNPDGFGWHLDRQKFEQFLRNACRDRSVECHWPAKLVSSEFKKGFWTLVMDTGPVIEAQFVMDAGGRGAPFARRQGAARDVSDKLITSWITIKDKGSCGLGTICSVENGWWYSAPLPNGRRVVAFQSDSDLMEKSVKTNEDAFLAAACGSPVMEQSLGVWDCERDEVIHHGVTASNSTRLLKVAGNGWAALGDAALSFDPLSSQGMFHAMASAMQLAELLSHSDDVENSYGEQIERIWHQYERHKRIFYDQETRWRDALFWQRRQQA